MITQTLGYINATTESEQTARTATDNRRKDKLYYIKQKLTGVILIGLGIISAVISDDGTFLIFMLIMSIPLFGKDKVLMIEEDDER